MRRRLPLPLRSTVLAAVAAAVLAPVGLAAPAAAHTRLVSSTPAAGASAEAPAQVVLVFDDPVQPALSALSVTGADGREHVAGTPAASGDGTSVSQALQGPLAPGTYSVAYRVLAADGHPITGSYAFTAAAAPATAAPTAVASATPPPSAGGQTTGPVDPAATERDEDGGTPVLPLAVGGLVVAGAAGLLARRLGGAPPEA